MHKLGTHTDPLYKTPMKPFRSLVFLALGLFHAEAFSMSPTSLSGFHRINTISRSSRLSPNTRSMDYDILSPSALNLWSGPMFGSEGRATLRRGNLRALGQKMRKWTRKTLLMVGLFLALNFGSALPASARGGFRTGGRMGGSFGAPTRAPITRSIPRSYHQTRSQPILIRHRRPHVHIHSSPTPYIIGDTAVMSSFYAGPVRRLSSSDLVLVAGVGSMVALNVMDKLKGENDDEGLETSLGPGISVLSITAAINVPDRDSPNSILARLARLAVVARTDSRKGVQDLITEAALELLRQRDYIVSVDSSYSHFSRLTDAQRAFNILSLGGRSKVDEETSSNFGGERKDAKRLYAELDKYPRATVAVVTINLCIEGDSTEIKAIKNRNQLQSALSRIASDCQVDECLLSAEVLWSPESKTERMTSEDVYEDYPSLFPLYD